MSWRLDQNVPPVGEAEFAALAAWFDANAARLDRLADQNGLPLSGTLDVGKIGNCPHADRVRSWMMTDRLRDGPRAHGSGHTAEIVRRLRARYPEGTTDGTA
jgi:hypothetical protein